VKWLVTRRQYPESERSRLPLSRLSRTRATCLLLFTLSPAAGAAELDSEEVLDCLIEPWVLSDVGSPVQGVVATLLVDRGERVAKGQPLAQLESGVEHSDVALAAIRAETQSEVLAREVELTLARLERDRLESLHRQKMVTPQQRDESTARYQIATAALAQALKNRKIQQLELERTKQQYSRRILTSPMDGVVAAQFVDAGEFVYDNPVMTIAALDPLRVEVVLPARLFGTIAVGDAARLYPELESDALVSTVDVVDPVLDSRSGTFGVRLTLANPDNTIPAGQHCRVTFDPELAAAVTDSTVSGERTTRSESVGQ